MQNGKKTVCWKIAVFLVLLNAIGWIGWWIASSDGSVEARDLGTLVWLIGPLIVSLVIRLISRDWDDIGIGFTFKGNWRWYIYSFLIFPVIIGLLLLIGFIFSSLSFSSFRAGTFISALGASLVFTVVKNIAEEFSWRGFMTPKVKKLIPLVPAGHLVTGIFWGLWHIPYYLALLDRGALEGYTSIRMAVFLPMVILGITLSGVLFGEIRLVTGSVWPGVLMHTVSNLLTVTLLTGNHIAFSGKTEILFTPGWHGIIFMIVISLAGCMVYGKRKAREKSS
ncbi:MAG: CPBP family intramembrane metalloprotease [Spirochaetales bacterium]|nr:CPBP family intramembrane metalloprotease [Spirochaetales bacterium]